MSCGTTPKLFVEFFARIFSTGREQVVVGIFQSLNAVMPCLFAKWRLPEWLGGMLQQLTLKGTFRCSLDGQTHTFWLYRWSWVHTLQVTAFRKIFCKISKCPDIQGICIKNHKDIYMYLHIDTTNFVLRCDQTRLTIIPFWFSGRRTC